MLFINFLTSTICISMMWLVSCSPTNLCKKLSKTKPLCDRTYFWDDEQQNFVSLVNRSTRSFDINDSHNFKQKRVKVLVTNLMPYVTYIESCNCIEGYLGDIWEVIKERFQFKDSIESKDYDRAQEMISSGEADVLLAAVVFKENLKNVHYSHPYFYNWYHLYMKSPKGKPLSSLYLNTFSCRLWTFSCIVFALLTVSVWLSSQILNYTCQVERCISIPSSFMGILSGFINQGFDLKLTSYTCRLQVMVALVFGVVLYYAMNAVLVAKMAVFEAPYPFKSLPDIADTPGLSLCLRSGSFVYNNFTDKNKNILPKWQKILNNKNCLDINNAMNISKIICNDNVIVLENKVIMSSLSKFDRLSCRIDTHGGKYFRMGNMFLMSRRLGRIRLLDNYILHIRTTGILKKLEERWIEKRKMVEEEKASAGQVTMEHTRSVFIFYVVAVFVSFIILALEILHEKYMKSHCTIFKTQ